MKKYDVIVIGGGPAGIFAAGFAALSGARVLLLEKKRRCGSKLLITGKGRCNVTNSETDPRRFSEVFGRNGKALLTALYAFGVDDTINFFQERGLPLKIERGGRVFPEKGKAIDVKKVLDRFVVTSGVALRTSCTVQKIHSEGGLLTSVDTSVGKFAADRFVIATGGLSYPETGCTGDGYDWAKKLDHSLIVPEPALVPVFLAENWTRELSDFNLKNVHVAVQQQGKIMTERFGEAFFTAGGIGGPIILDMSADIRAALKRGEVQLLLDLKPAVELGLFDKRLQRELAAHSNKAFHNSLDNLLPKDMIPLFLRLSGIAAEKKCHSVTRTERNKLLSLFKALELTVTGVEGFKKAIITSGGIPLNEIDMRTMCSRKVANLYFAGEIIDLDGPTGGYNLQLCWSTGYLAGISAAGC
ncbi:NAD(P)/FAD-dependent oxidoreductase [uncultured Desulfuromusa sp.]|uniref:NAD(P)/FAD-dependent oxidoreductase n=1 Tax=uncultured Desulfuromusa sp. TaxID=219183 RepID=UPI002AA8BA6B|nr:NAD(P)/FAD-dependent oxidoreductase [uncultured Desulfuromusa sp.]